MNNNLSFTKKVLLSVWIVILFIFSIIYFIVMDEYKSSILKEENNKIDIIIRNAIPLISVNFEFELYDAMRAELQELVLTNKQIVSVEILNTQEKSVLKIVSESSKEEYLMKKEPIFGTLDEPIGYICVEYSNENYLESIEKFNKSFIILLLVVFVITILFGGYLKSIFQPLTYLANQLDTYDLDGNRKINLYPQKTKDEIALINNTLLEMLNRIEEHTLTLEKRIEEETQKNMHHQLKLYENAKMAQMGEMIGNIAHQWRQPLSAISTVASGVQLNASFSNLTKEQLDENMEIIIKKTEYLSKIIETFREFLNENKEKENVVIQDKIKETLEIVGATLQNEQIMITNNCSNEAPIISNIVPSELPQVLINILNNAKDVLLERKIENKSIIISCEKKDKDIEITIEDNGGGIDKEVLPKIFNPYFTTKHQSQGTGLGLHMCYRIVKESLHGEIYVNNTQNGAKFFIRFPQEL
jgi:signal transduction histidine kinase